MYIKSKINDFYLLDSQVENIFINEYMPQAPGDYVKVYLYGQMYAQFGLEMNDRTLASQLGLAEKKVAEAWNYWEQMGAVRKLYFDEEGKVDFTVEFMSLKEMMYGKNLGTMTEPSDGMEEVYASEKIKDTFSGIEKTMGRSLSTTEIQTMLKWITDDRISPEVVLYCVEYCTEKDKNTIRYMDRVVHAWQEEGLNTVDDVMLHLQEVDQRFYQYRRVLRALGFTRNATEAEKSMMDRWFDEYGYSMDKVLMACEKTSGISSPNFNYVDKVLVGWKNEADRQGADPNSETVSLAQLKQYYEYLRNKAAKETERRTDEIYGRIPRIKEIDQRIQELGTILSRSLLMGSENREEPEIRKQMEELSQERAVLLTDNGYERDYTDVKYYCPDCRDTGITDLGERCHCVTERREEALVWLKQTGIRDGEDQ